MLTFTNRNTWMVQNSTFEPVIATLENGGLILYPTDTTWCIGCDATNPVAVQQVRELCRTTPSEPFILLVSSIEMLKFYAPGIHPRVETLLLYHNRPLTVVYEHGENLPQNALGPDGSVAIRIPKDDFCLALLEAFGKPIAAVTAQIGNAPYPKHFGEIRSDVIEGVNHVVKHRQMEKEMDEPSVIARLAEDEELIFLRE